MARPTSKTYSLESIQSNPRFDGYDPSQVQKWLLKGRGLTEGRLAADRGQTATSCPYFGDDPIRKWWLKSYRRRMRELTEHKRHEDFGIAIRGNRLVRVPKASKYTPPEEAPTGFLSDMKRMYKPSR